MVRLAAFFLVHMAVLPGPLDAIPSISSHGSCVQEKETTPQWARKEGGGQVDWGIEVRIELEIRDGTAKNVAVKSCINMMGVD